MGISHLATLSILESIVTTVLQRSAEINPDLARAILYCSVPRWFDADVIAGMCPSSEMSNVSTDEILQHLRSLSFCEPHPTRDSTWVFQEDVRTHFLKHKEVNEHRDQLHSRAAEIFERRLDAKTLEVEERFKDVDWKDLAAEWVYHLLHFDPDTGLKTIRRICAEALAVWTYRGLPEVVFCSELLESLDWSAGPEQVDREISSLRASINALLTENGVKALEMFHELVKVQGLKPEQEAPLHDWIGQIHLWDEGRLAPALDQFKLAWRLTPKDAIVHAHIAEVYYSPGAIWGRFDLAQQHAHNAIELAPAKATGYIALGKVAELQEDYDEAIAWYQKAIEAEPQSYSGYLSQSEVYSACGDWSRALAKIDEAVKVSPDIKYHALVRRGNVYSGARLYKEARGEYEQAIAEAPDRIDAYRELGQVYESELQVAEAEKKYRKVIELELEVADGYVGLGRLYLRLDKLDRAIAISREAEDKKIEAKRLYILLSDLYGQQNRLEDLQRAQEQLALFDPEEEYAAHCAIGDAWLDKAQRRRGSQDRGRWLERARSEYEKALTIDANRAGAYLSKARLAVIQDDTDTVQQQQRLIDELAPWAKYEMLVNLGRAYLENFQYTEAKTMLLAAAEMAPRRTEAWRALSELYNRQGNPEGVTRAWSELVNINPTLAYDMRMSAGDAYRQVADYARAREEYNQAKEIEPDTYDAYWALAGVDEDEDMWENAIDNYRIVENKAPGLAANAYMRIAAIYRDQEKYDDAERAVRRAIFLDSEYAELYIELARLGAARGEEGLVEEGRRHLPLVSADKLYDFDKAIGDIYRQAGKHKEAEQAYRECIKRDPERAEAYIGLGLLQLSQGLYPEAKEWLTHAMEIDSANVEVYSALSQVYEDQQNLQDVIQTQNRIVKLDPTKQYDAHLAIGIMYEKVNKLDEAERQFRAATSLARWRADAYAYLFSLLRRLDKPEEARKVCQEAKDAADVSYLRLGQYYEQQKMLDDAKAVYQQAIAEEPGSPAAYDQLAQLLVNEGQLEEAIKAYRQMAEQPELTYIAQILTGDLLAAEERDKAEAAYRQAIELDRKNPLGYLRLAQLMADEGRLDEAIEVCRQMAEQPELTYDAQISIGNLLRDKAAYDEAEAAYRRAIEVDPKQADAYIPLALLSYRQNKLEEVEQLLRQASEVAPQNPVPQQLLAELREQQGRWDEAIKLYSRAVELQPAGTAASDIHLRIGNLLIEQKRYAEAEQELQQAVRGDSTNAVAYYSLGRLYEEQGQVEPALDSYTKATELAPKYRDPYLALGRLYAQREDTKSLTSMAQRILELDLQPAEQYDAYLLVAEAYQTAKDTNQAAAIYHRAIEFDPMNPEGYVRLAQLLTDEDRLDEAVEICRQMAEQPELAYDAQILTGDLLAAEERDGAEAAYRQAIELDRKNPLGYLRLAQLMADEGRLDEAIEVCRQMAEQPELTYDAQISIGNLLRDKAAYDEAEAAYRRAIEVDPKQADAYIPLALLSYRQNKLEETEKLLQRASEAAPQNPVPQQLLAELREQQGRWDEAIKLYSRAVELQPAGTAASDIHLRIGNLLIEQKRYAEAEQELQQAVRSDPTNAVAYYSLGKLFEEQGQVEPALDSYTKATELAPKYRDPYLALGRLYAQREDTKSLTLMAQRILGMDLEPAEQYDAYLLVAEAYQRAGLHEWAIDHLDKAISLDPRRLEAHFALGPIYEIQQRWAKAREVYENIGQLSPESQPDVHLRVGQLFVLEESPEEAEREFRKVSSLALEPTGVRFEQLTSGYLNTASIYRKLGKREAMREVCAEVVSLAQRSPSPDHNALRRQGLAYLMREEYAEAAQALRRALEANPADNKARLYLAVNLLPQGDPAEAQSQLKQAIEQTQHRADYDYAIEETEAIAMRVPEVAGAKEMLRALHEARDKTAQ